MIVSRQLMEIATAGGRIPAVAAGGWEAGRGAPVEAGADVAVVAEPAPGSGSSAGILRASKVLEKSQVS